MKIHQVKIVSETCNITIATYNNIENASLHIEALKEKRNQLLFQIEKLKNIYGEYRWTKFAIDDPKYCLLDEELSKLGGYSWTDDYLIESYDVKHFFNAPVPNIG